MNEAPLTVRDLRKQLGLTLDEFAVRIGITSRGYASRIEAGAPCSVAVALEIEKLSSGRINARALSRDVALVDAARGRVDDDADHAAADTAPSAPASPGNGADFSRPVPAASGEVRV